jgi:hypothetical protein
MPTGAFRYQLEPSDANWSLQMPTGAFRCQQAVVPLMHVVRVRVARAVLILGFRLIMILNSLHCFGFVTLCCFSLQCFLLSFHLRCVHVRLTCFVAGWRQVRSDWTSAHGWLFSVLCHGGELAATPLLSTSIHFTIDNDSFSINCNPILINYNPSIINYNPFISTRTRSSQLEPVHLNYNPFISTISRLSSTITRSSQR